MKYYIIAGEASGDLHGSNLIKELKLLDSNIDVRCWGGDLMQQTGATLAKHYRELAFMGFIEVVMNLRTILKNLSFCKEDIQQYQPDVLVLIDYPGFNLRIAEWGKQQGYRIVYYISPQVWAWKESRVKKMKQHIDRMLVILPFEKDYFRDKWNWDVEYVGHPLVKVIEEYKEGRNKEEEIQGIRFKEQGSRIKEEEARDKGQELRSKEEKEEKEEQGSRIKEEKGGIIALLPGSRKQEILKKLPIMLEVSKAFSSYHFVVAKAPGQEDSFYDALLAPFANVSSVRNKTYDLLVKAKAALVTSGTATLETALFGVLEVVCYKASSISYQIAKRLIKIKYISLVNLIMDKLVVKELIQDELTVKNLTIELDLLLNNDEKKNQLQKDYKALKEILSAGGDASAKAASSIYKFISSK